MSAAGFVELMMLLEMLASGQGGGGGPQPGPPGPPGPPAPTPDVPVPPAVVPPPIIPSVAPLPVPPITPILPPPGVIPTPVIPAVVPVAPPVSPGVLPPMPPWPSGPTPGTLPPFPGPGWVPDTPVTPAISARAAYWNPLLWDYPTKTIRKAYVQEQLGGQWVTFAAAWHPGAQGPQTYMATEAWRLATAQPVAPQPIPTPAPVVPMSKPGPVGPYPGAGAWQTNTAYIRKYQTALTYLGKTMTAPTWDPGGIDGKYGPKTKAAVIAYQRDHALTTDGEAGAQTAASLDALLGYGAAPAPLQTPAAPPPAPGPTPGPASPLPVPGPPPLVSPYPGPGAWQTNSAYIARYQNALAWLATTLGHTDWNPQGVDGKYGPHTQAAVRAFQAANGLTVDGQAGAATAAALDAALSHAQAAA